MPYSFLQQKIHVLGRTATENYYNYGEFRQHEI